MWHKVKRCFKVTAFGIAMSVSAVVMASGTFALVTKSASTSTTNSYYHDSISDTGYGATTVLSVYYLYGASQTGKADLQCIYAYDTYSGTKWAKIGYAGVWKAQNSANNDTIVSVTKTDAVSGTATYYGYTQACPSNSIAEMSYYLTLS